MTTRNRTSLSLSAIAILIAAAASTIVITEATGTTNLISSKALANGNIVPSADNKFTLGTKDMRWKSLQLGPGTLYIQDQETGTQAGLTVNAGALLLDGTDSLRIGNVRFTATGIDSLVSNQDITIGNSGDQGYLVLARAVKFPDGTIQSTASLTGLTGPTGAPGKNGDVGAQGPAGEDGAPGEVGLTGATGPAGPKGDVGAQGPQGAQGVVLNTKGSFPTRAAFDAAGIIGVTGDAWIIVQDGSLLVWNSLTNKWDNVGDLVGKQGLQGIQGVPGAQGPQGPQGPTGATGATGANGAQGPQGLQGIPGPQGDVGATGATGATGAPGPQGDKGDKGDKGDTGLQGPQGLQGIPGPQGEPGATGAPGPQGDKGDKGDKGDTGLQGPIGPQGPAGPSGSIAPYQKQAICAKENGGKTFMYLGTCATNGVSDGVDYVMLIALPF